MPNILYFKGEPGGNGLPGPPGLTGVGGKPGPKGSRGKLGKLGEMVQDGYTYMLIKVTGMIEIKNECSFFLLLLTIAQVNNLFDT